MSQHGFLGRRRLYGHDANVQWHYVVLRSVNHYVLLHYAGGMWTEYGR